MVYQESTSGHYLSTLPSGTSTRSHFTVSSTPALLDTCLTTHGTLSYIHACNNSDDNSHHIIWGHHTAHKHTNGTVSIKHMACNQAKSKQLNPNDTKKNHKKVKSTMLHKTSQAGAYLPLPGLEPIGEEPLISVTRGSATPDLHYSYLPNCKASPPIG